MLESPHLGRYLLVRKIASGGMAEIFLSKLQGAEGFEKELVIKKILPQWGSDQDFITMLIDEAKIAVQLTHPNIIQVYELGREGETYYIAMEYLDGVDLRRLMQKAPKGGLPIGLAVRIVMEVLEALAYAHSKGDSHGGPLGIIHRDISPQNILVGFDGTVKLTDFGIAKAASRSHETATGFLKGKYAYMSPEQANQRPLDTRTDLFSLAVVFYELLTGEKLFFRGSDLDTLDAVRRGDYTLSLNPKIPDRLREILLKALVKEREGRFPDAGSFREEISQFAKRTRKLSTREQLGSFVSALFAEEKKSREVTGTFALPSLGRKSMKKPPRFISLKWFSAIGAGTAVIGLFLFVLKGRLEKTPPPMSAVVTAIPEGNPATPPPTQEPREKGRGYLSVQAIPWGAVLIDGKRTGETPIRRFSLSAGHHSVEVLHEPSGKKFFSRVSVALDREVVCLANFNDGKELRCGP